MNFKIFKNLKSLCPGLTPHGNLSVPGKPEQLDHTTWKYRDFAIICTNKKIGVIRSWRTQGRWRRDSEL